MRSTRTAALVGVQPSESVTRPGHGRYQSGGQGHPLTPPPSAHHHQPISISPSALPSPSAKAWWAFADGLLVFEPLSAFHTSAAKEKFKGTQARTKNTPGWSVSAVSEECWLTFSKFNSHSLSDSTKTTHCTYNTGLPRVWWHMLEKPHQVLSTVKNSVKKIQVVQLRMCTLCISPPSPECLTSRSITKREHHAAASCRLERKSPLSYPGIPGNSQRPHAVSF